MYSSKNKQPEHILHEMVKRAFGGVKATSITELTEGMCNVAYSVTLADKREAILKIAPKDTSSMLACEINMMHAEVEAMELVRKMTHIPVAEIYYHDESCSLCDSEFFFMEKLPGVNYFFNQDKFSESMKKSIDREMGRIEKELSSIKGTRFGYMCDYKGQRDSWFDAFYIMLDVMLLNSEAKAVDIGISYDELRAMLQRDRSYFEDITIPSLAHWDMWEGNIFVNEQSGKICGVIDWERAMWADPLIEERFRRHTRTDEFLNGFGIKSFDNAELRRVQWYDIYLYIIMMTEGKYRDYPDDSQYNWVRPLFDATVSEIR